MIGPVTYVSILIMMAGGILLPLALIIWWLVTRKEMFTTVLAGAATWFVFAIILESIPKIILFNPATALGKTVTGNVVLFTALAALLAGVFEEGGRFFVFKTFLKKRTQRETAISHGIGHGGFEAMFVMGVAGVQNLAYAFMIQTGAFEGMAKQLIESGADEAVVAALQTQLVEMTPRYSLLAVGERVFAILLHIALSIVVFYAVRNRKTWMVFLAMLLHALFDVPAALYQQGILNMYVTEAILAVYALLFFVAVYRGLYLKLSLNRVLVIHKHT